MTPKNGSLTPYFEEMSPKNNGLSPEQNSDLSIKPDTSGDSGQTGDISDTLKVEEDRPIVVKETESSRTGQMVGFREPFYYCKHHPNVQNIHRER
jgi:hypothetical protein